MLHDVIRQVAGVDARLLVIGDLILDRYTWGEASRVSPEAPVVVLHADSHEDRLGGAAAVAGILAHWGVSVQLLGVVGDDPAGEDLLRLLDDAGIGRKGVERDSARPTTRKERYIGRAGNRHPHQMLRVDWERRRPLDGDSEQSLAALLSEIIPNCDGILVSDYGKGVCTPRLMGAIADAARGAGVPLLVDPARGADYSMYARARWIKPNRREAELATSKPIETVEDALFAGDIIRRRHGVDVAITLEHEGMVVVSSTARKHFPTRQRHVRDVTGAGDVAFAALGMGCLLRLEDDEVAALINLAAGLQVERWGVSPISLADLAAACQPAAAASAKVASLEQAESAARQRRDLGETVVFTNGCFDMLHYGHVRMLQEAASWGDWLIVAINSDESVRSLKGPQRPVIPEQVRAAMLAAMECVDQVLVFDAPTPSQLLQSIRPDVLAKGGTTESVVGREFVESYGSAVRLTAAIDGFSTTHLLAEAAERAGQGGPPC